MKKEVKKLTRTTCLEDPLNFLTLSVRNYCDDFPSGEQCSRD